MKFTHQMYQGKSMLQCWPAQLDTRLRDLCCIATIDSTKVAHLCNCQRWLFACDPVVLGCTVVSCIMGGGSNVATQNLNHAHMWVWLVAPLLDPAHMENQLHQTNLPLLFATLVSGSVHIHVITICFGTK